MVEVLYGGQGKFYVGEIKLSLCRGGILHSYIRTKFWLWRENFPTCGDHTPFEEVHSIALFLGLAASFDHLQQSHQKLEV